MMIKKLIAKLLILGMIASFIPLNYVHATLDLNTFSINGSDSFSFYFNPGDTFTLNAYSTNDIGEEIKDARVKVIFSNNSVFSYSGGDQKSQVQGVDTFNPIPAGDYSSSTGLDAPISNTNVPIGHYLMLKKITNAFSAFSVSDSISSYSNTVTISFDAKKVSDSSGVTGSSSTKTIYVNVKPHIIDKYFEKSGITTTTIKGNGAELVDLLVKVKDYNGCTNIDSSNVTADLSLLGLSSSESLIYDSCEGDGKTALFKKSGISTLSGLGLKTFSSSDFSITDENGNTNDSADSNFVESGETDAVVITVESPGAPDITNLGLTDDYIGGIGNPQSTISFSGNQSGTSKVAIDSCSQADVNKIFEDTTTYSGSTVKNVIIDSSKLSEGSNSIFACVDNGLGDIGSLNFNITKDTVNPIISSLSYTANITTADVSLGYKCSEDGDYKVDVTDNSSTSTVVNYTNISADTQISESLPNSAFTLGSNVITIYCRDNANNEIYQTGSLNKVAPTPSMSGEISGFSDNDIDNNGLNGIDIKIDWNAAIGTGFSAFESWRLYVLPSSTPLNIGTHNYVKLIAEAGTGSFIGDESLTNDSAGDILISGGSYKAYVTIMGTSGELGTVGESTIAVLTSDVIQQATITSAEFISDTQLKLYTDTTLDTILGSHDASLITYDVSGSKTATAIESISGQNMIVTIPVLSDTSAIGTNLVIGTGAIHSSVGGYNDGISAGNISDKQSPIISSFTNGTAPAFGTFYDTNIDFSWTIGEAITPGNTYIRFTRTSGNADNTIHKANITSPTLLTSGIHNSVININSNSNSSEVLLTCGTTYKTQFIGEDSAGNTATSSEITNLSFDNCNPDTPIQNELTLEGITNFNLTWSASIDDNGNGSGIRDYNIELFDGSSCSSSNTSFSGITITSQAVTLVDGDYSWNIKAYDNMGNISLTSSCDNFSVDSNIPTFSNNSITDTILSNSTYAKNGNTIEVKSDITNTDINNIIANLASLTGNAGDTAVACSSPIAGITCSYIGTTVTYAFTLGYAGSLTEGVRQADIIANNTSGINTQNKLLSITVDKNNPTVTSNAITYPNGGETIGGTGIVINWNTANVSDTIGLQTVDISYLKGGVNQGIICSGANNGSCTWDLTSITSDPDYSIEIKATDLVGNSSTDTSDTDFTVDRNAPSVPSNTLTIPNGGGIYQGGDNISITWNNGNITDAGGLKTNPITLDYSSNNGTNYTQVSTNETNDGAYSWILPSINSNQTLVQITATDNVGNFSTDVSDATFIIDSTDPSLDISFAGNGGNTPQNGKYINNSGLNITLTSSDSYMDNIYYTFENTSDSTYWNGTSFSGGITNNTLCSDSAVLGTDNTCDTITTNITPSIVQGNTYRMIIYAIDEAGNLTTSTFVDYTGDITNPILSITNLDGIFISTDITLAGTSSDSDSEVSSVFIQIQKGTDYWNGSSFVGTVQSLATTTSDGYTNWSYDFTLPVGDTDAQDYTITAIAYDNAFKVNNSTSQSITITKDTTGPTVGANTITSPLAGIIFSGGDNITVNWTPGNITDIVSGLTGTPIKLEYFDGSTYNLMVENIANSGTYAWNTIPSINTNNARIRITGLDKAGNTSFQNSDSFTIDSTNPAINSIETLENNISNGTINALKIIFSENINDSSIVFGDFTIDGGSITPTGISTGGGSDDDEILLLFSETGTTGSKPTVVYSGTSVEDLAGRKLQNTGTLNSIDKATPRVETIEAFDNDSNGKLDKIAVTYSESLSASTTISGWNIDNILAGMSITSFSISGDTMNLNLSESTNFETSTTGLSLDLSAPIYIDTAGNTVESFSNELLTDKAFPIKLSTQTLDLDSNYKSDNITLSFSENISGEILGEFILGNLSTGTSSNSITVNGKDVNITLNETTDDNDTDNTFTVTYTGNSLQDVAGNKVNTISLHNSDDTLPAKILTRKTIDNDSNGQIDSIEITTSENLNDNFTGVNLSVEGYTVNSLSSGIANDTLFTANLQEKSTADTNAIPNIRIISNSSLGDTNNNLLLNEVGTTTASDTVGPVIIGSRYDEVGVGVSDDIIYVTFSEDISAASFDLSVGGSSNDFEITLGGVLAGSSTTTITSPTQVTITLGAGATILDPGTTKIGINTGALTDNNTNNSPSVSNNNRIIVSASVIINEIMFSTDADNQYIELKNLGSSIVDISGWIIENAGGNGIDLTISSGNIAGHSFYLIAKQSEGISLLNVTPDLVDNTLNLNSSSQNNIVLKDGATVFDTVLSSPWPAGNNSSPKSMERNINPGNGITGSNWYTAETSTGFDNQTINGTPGIANIFDGIAPTIDSQFPTDNTLLPTAGHIRFDYSDTGVGVDGSTKTITLQKWSGSSYDADISGTDIINTDVNNLRAIFTLTDLDSGKYKTQFTISDNAGNTVNKEVIFYIDKFSMKITGGNINIGDIDTSVNQFSSGEITITVKTVGAGFNITQTKSGLFSQGIINIGDHDGSYGFGYDLYKDENDSISNYSSNISVINGGNITNISKNIDTNGVLKIYTYKMKYGVKIGGMQNPGKYSTDVSYSHIINY